jgi:hypothetical protein
LSARRLIGGRILRQRSLSECFVRSLHRECVRGGEGSINIVRAPFDTMGFPNVKQNHYQTSHSITLSKS